MPGPRNRATLTSNLSMGGGEFPIHIICMSARKQHKQRQQTITTPPITRCLELPLFEKPWLCVYLTFTSTSCMHFQCKISLETMTHLTNQGLHTSEIDSNIQVVFLASHDFFYCACFNPLNQRVPFQLQKNGEVRWELYSLSIPVLLPKAIINHLSKFKER